MSLKYHNPAYQIPKEFLFNRQTLPVESIDSHAIFEVFTSLGGQKGWVVWNFLWYLRGIIDKIIGGPGLRGRKNPKVLQEGDFVDFWIVSELEVDKKLLLYSQMKMPSHGWLEFKIENKKFIQTAYFEPCGFFGYFYWYALLPIHNYIFKNMAIKIIEEAKGLSKNAK